MFQFSKRFGLWVGVRNNLPSNIQLVVDIQVPVYSTKLDLRSFRMIYSKYPY